MSRWRRLAPAAALLAALGLGTPARAATAEVGTSVEAWYARMPSAETRPADTLHVGVFLGVEESRTYVALDVGGVDVERITGGRLRVPVDLDASRAPESATIDVCVAGSPGPAVQGSTDEPPPADCSTAAPATFDATDAVLVADLSPFVASLATSGLALVPRAPAPGPTTWHVAMWASTSSAPDARPIRATLDLEDPPGATAPPAASTRPAEPAAAPASTFASEGTAFGSTAPFGRNEAIPSSPPAVVVPTAAEPVAPSLGPPDASVAPPAAPAAPLSTRTPLGAAPPNSVAFALPLLLLALAGYVGSALTRPALPPAAGPAPDAPPPAPPRDGDVPGRSTAG